MGRLTTHVLDTAHGCPAASLVITLYRLGSEQPLITVTTNADGRCDGPLLQDADFTSGRYRLVFQVGEYFATRGVGDTPPFLDEVVIQFGVQDSDSHYHVPLLVSPWSYTTYRGS